MERFLLFLFCFFCLGIEMKRNDPDVLRNEEFVDHFNREILNDVDLQEQIQKDFNSRERPQNNDESSTQTKENIPQRDFAAHSHQMEVEDIMERRSLLRKNEFEKRKELQEKMREMGIEDRRLIREAKMKDAMKERGLNDHEIDERVKLYRKYREEQNIWKMDL
jgi:hypothetical protein